MWSALKNSNQVSIDCEYSLKPAKVITTELVSGRFFRKLRRMTGSRHRNGNSQNINVLIALQEDDLRVCKIPYQSRVVF